MRSSHIVADRARVGIMANPYSGFGANRRRVEKLTEALRRQGLKPRPIWDRAERAVLQESGWLGSCRCVVAAGGDGTVSDVINSRPGVPLAVLPLGTENLFARDFGFTTDVEALARAILAGQSRTIDLARAGGRLFSLMLGVGFDADVAHRVARWRVAGRHLRRVTYLSYVGPILNALRDYRHDPIELEADGIRVRGAHAWVFNVPRYSLGLQFAPHARDDDGWLDWVVFERPGARSLLSCTWAVRRGRHLALPGVRHGRARSIRITAEKPVPVQADGDEAGWTPVEVQVVPRALQVIVP